MGIGYSAVGIRAILYANFLTGVYSKYKLLRFADTVTGLVCTSIFLAWSHGVKAQLQTYD